MTFKGPGGRERADESGGAGLDPNDRSSPAALVARVQAGDKAAEEEIFHRYKRGVIVILQHAGASPEAAEDLYQETLLIALPKVRQGAIREPDRLAGFICGVARYCLLSYNRKEAHLHVAPEVDMAASSAEGQDETLSRREEAELVRKVLDGLSRKRDRDLLVRFFLEGDDRETICREMGMTSVHFSRVLYRALQRFRELYEKTIQLGRTSKTIR